MTDVKIVTKDEVPGYTTLRRVIAFSIFIYAMVFGLPLWFTTTSIYRAELPIEEINTLTNNLNNEVSMKIPIYVSTERPDFSLTQVQSFLNDQVKQQYPSLQDSWRIELLKVEDKTLDSEDKEEKDVYVLTFEDSKVNGLPIGASTATTGREIKITYAANDNDIEKHISKSLLNDVFGEELEALDKLFNPSASRSGVDVVLPYSRRYNIVFSLFTEGGNPISWDIAPVTTLLQPLLDQFNHFANFSITSQVQYYSKSDVNPVYNEAGKAFEIEEKDLSTFINFGDWNLFSHELTPTINFLVYFAESNYDHKPLTIKGSKSKSFLIPQWGGVYLFNKDLPIRKGTKVRVTEDELIDISEVFISQLFKLIGVTQHPNSLSIKIDILSRISTVQNIQKSLDNLRSLVKLTEALEQISIPELTKEYVEISLSNIHSSLKSLNDGDFGNSVTDSASSVESSNKAFFEKEMVQQAYFPQEHMMAVYLPLLGPLLSIITLGGIRALKELKSRK